MSDSAQNQASSDQEKQTRVLLVDDSKVMRKSALKMLGNEFDVVVAEDGEQGWEMIQKDPNIHVVFTDLNMPNIDGYKLIKLVRANPKYHSIPIIILSSLSKDEDINLGLSTGANSYLIKPFNSRRIQYEVAKYIG